MKRNNYENSTYVLLGVPILLLIISLFLFKEENKTILTIEGFNPYLNIMPNNYSRALNKIKVNDSSFFSTTIENFSIRKLLIFKAHPTDKEMKTDFTVELYPTQKTLLKGNADFLIFTTFNYEKIYIHITFITSISYFFASNNFSFTTNC